ncbi:MAG: DUF3325 domain-containing protein [Pseudomonadota bacterium]
MTAFIAFVLSLAGAVAICLAMNRHWRTILPGLPRRKLAAVALRVLGVAVLLLSVSVTISYYGTGVGMAVFFGLFTVAHFLLAILLAYSPLKGKEDKHPKQTG